ncbi:complement factor H-related protein 2-like [Callorhinchus milii]|uniref:complement factor H-related protein 2-like n=1 Tax=Callorhinchus milii TaxID=7868 RepID=UPI001C3F58B7|nr:complement factor H-related protein 2-like [Callorhinchus milii]
MKCDQPPRVPSGDFIEFWKTTYDHGETRTFECQDYYILEGPNVVQCIEGQWTPTPTCREPCVVSLKIFQTNKINLKSQNNTKLYVRHGEYLEFICSAGHSIETGVSLKQYCFNGHMTFPTCYRDRETEDCFPLQYLKCPNCAGSIICVQYQWDVISVSKPDAATLVLTAETGQRPALFTVMGKSEQLTFNVTFSGNFSIQFNDITRM